MPNDSKDSTNICSSMHPADKVDPFEGLNLESICVSPAKTNTSNSTVDGDSTSGKQLFDLNPLDGIDLQEISANPKISPSPKQRQEYPEIKPEEKEPSQTHPPGTKIAQPTVTDGHNLVSPILDKACRYAEVTQIRQQVLASLRETNGKILLIASPCDNTGSSFLAAALAHSIASSCQKHVLLIDCNMRRAGLHKFFSLSQSYGFTDLIHENLTWKNVVKKTGISDLNIITAGDPINNFSEHLRFDFIQNLMQDVRNTFDIVIIDTSPILTPNRNNVDIISLTQVADYFLLSTKIAGTTKDQLQETQDIIEAGKGKINGIVVNQFTPAPKSAPFKG
jgi:capsular exopolysaccharide synthesis family protein